jgi:tRNA-2-methylthio-N6-dimethylallyladenosine synthase
MAISLDALSRSERPRFHRGTYFVQTWGCQMNEEDSEQMARHLESIGFGPADSIQQAHVILLNTCSVRKKPEDKAFSLLGELALLKQRRPEIIVGVCGCMAQLRANEIRQRNPFVDFVVGTGQISAIPGLVEEAAQSRRFQMRLDLPERRGSVVTDVPKRLLLSPPLAAETAMQTEVESEAKRSVAKIKAFVPIQYGCDKFCSFCIVPTTRGRERSRPTEEIVHEVRSLAGSGVREVTLLGQTVNSYGKNLAEGRVPFSKLLWLLDGIPGLERIRYTSPYPRDFKTDLIQCIRDCHKVMEHVHLPLQSGDDEMLRAMRRQYTVEGFVQIVADLRAAVPGIGITTDIIVGFPGETDEQFDGTLEVMRKVRFDGAFMFIYSPRPGTPAADMEQISLGVKKERFQRLAELQNAITMERNEALVGETFEVLCEGASPKDSTIGQGYSREFKMMHFPLPGHAPNDLAGKLIHVRAEAAHPWGLSGKLA